MYLITSLLPHILPDLPTSLPTQLCYFPFPLQQTENNNRKQNNKKTQKSHKITKMKIETSKEPFRLKKKKDKAKMIQKDPRNTLSSFRAVQVLLGMGSTLECDGDIPSETIGEN